MKKDEYFELMWLKSTQTKLKKYISSPYWDNISMPDTFYSIISQIMNAKSPKQLSPSINESLTDMILEKIEDKIKKCKLKDNGR